MTGKTKRKPLDATAKDFLRWDAILRRALAGYFSKPGCAFPPCWDIQMKTVGGLAYVHIIDVSHGTLAVYRLMNDGQLRRLKVWPAKVAPPYPATKADEE